MLVIALDILTIPLAWFLACWFKSSTDLFLLNWHTLVTLMGIDVACYYGFQVHRGLRCFSSSSDVIRIIKAVFVATVISLPIFYLFSWFGVIAKSLLLLHALLLISFLCGMRLISRSYWDRNNQAMDDASQLKRVLVIGAGRAGESLIRDMKRTIGYEPIGVLDDDHKKKGQEVHGVRVLGRMAQLPELALNTGANLIVIAIPSANTHEMQQIVSLCEKSAIPFRTLPSLSAITSGHVEINMLKPVHLEDLLGRDQVELDWDKIETEIQERAVLVTGAGGSIGSELCRQIAKLKPKQLLLLDDSEPNLYHIEFELKRAFPMLSIKIALCSIIDEVALKAAFAAFKPAIVLHAAAYKHVPLLENQIRSGIFNNVLGTCMVAQVSVSQKVEKFIFISTDKAVNPTSVMGATKRVAEIYCQNLNERVDTQFITVRFGNVLGSVGSVVPLFQEQLKNGGPLTVTHSEVERYFMTIPEASQLILQAMVNGEGGEIFMLDMGEPVKITYLAEQMIRLSGKIPGKDIQIEYTGLRPGEKLFEELFHPSEELKETAHEKLFKARFRRMNWEDLMEAMKLIQSACIAHEDDELKVLLKSLVPEFKAEQMEVTT